MNVHYSKELQHAFVVGLADLKKIVELLQKRIGKVEINAGCADDLSREFKTLKELITYENPKPKEIRSIHLRARSDNYSKSTTVVFRKSSRFSSGISIDANGREDVISRLKEEILDIIGGMRPWYGVMHRVNFFYIFLISWFILLTIRILSYISALALKFKWVPVSEKLTSLAALPRGWLVILSILLLVLGIFSNKLRDFFFPPAVFMIGQGESRYKRKEQFQWVVIVGFGVSLAASLVVPVITIIF